MDSTHGDLTRAPLSYPLDPVGGPRLLLAGCEHPVRPRRSRGLGAARWRTCTECEELVGAAVARPLGPTLDDLGVAPLAHRTPVLAVGSNAASPVLRHKLGGRGVSPVLPVVTGVVHDLAVTHSAHVSRGGYVPAAPVHRRAARTRVVLQLLDDDQLSAVDATEPNYERVEVSARRYPVVLAGGGRPERVHVYSSRRGVLDLPGRGAGPLLPQAAVLAALGRAGVPYTDGDAHEAAARLARSPEVREAVTRALDELGLVRESGLHAGPATELRWEDRARSSRSLARARRTRVPASRARPARSTSRLR
jgi:hypothetical protein